MGYLRSQERRIIREYLEQHGWKVPPKATQFQLLFRLPRKNGKSLMAAKMVYRLRNWHLMMRFEKLLHFFRPTTR